MQTRCLGCMSIFDADFGVCPNCGYVIGTPVEEAVHLAPGYRLCNRYLIGKVLGFGSFGVTYIAWDEKLEQKVAIKEYMPAEFSTRMPGQSHVTIFEGDKSQQFHDGLHKFVDEAKRLAKFHGEPGIVQIYDCVEENDTAYIIMEYLDGETLTDYLKREGIIEEDKAVSLLMPVMESLKAVHEAGILHRDIAPDNIFLTKNGEVKVIDFGASRYATTSHSRSLTVIIKQGFSPEEQYRSRSDQGPYTDVYAIAAVLYKMMTGVTPPDAMERRVEYETKSRDMLVAPHKINKAISVNRENAILNAMNVRIEDRTPDIPAFIEELNADPPAKRRYGKIKKIDIYAWPLWLKIAIPVLLAAVLTFGVLLVTGVIDFSRYTAEVVIPDNIVIAPDVEGTQKDDAVAMIESNNLLANISGNIESEYIAAGKIIRQTPVGGAFLEKNGIIELIISSGQGVIEVVDGKATVPYLIGDTKQKAEEKLGKAGLSAPVYEERTDENIAAGLIISSDPEAGVQVDEGSTVTLVVSTGPAAFAMPNVTGMEEASARDTLENRGLAVAVEYEKNDSVPEGNVIRQQPAANSDVKRGDTATIVVSSGVDTVEVPDVAGKTQAEAEKILKDAGFAVYVRENSDDEVPKGSVITQSPEAKTKQKKGSTITIFVSAGKQAITVTFDANGGKTDRTSQSVYYNENYGELPSAQRTGYEFGGWYTSASGGNRIETSTKVSEKGNHALFAHWTEAGYTVTFDANGGSVVTKSKTVKYGNSYGELPVPTKSGYGFDGWYTSADGGTHVEASTRVDITAGQTLYAHWSAGKVSVTFDPNGGSTPSNSAAVTYGQRYGNLPTPIREGYDFAGWYTSASGGELITSETTVANADSHVLYAHWSAVTMQITFNGNGGVASTDRMNITYGNTYGDLPTATREGYTFEAWYTQSSGGEKITSASIVTGNIMLYAHWNAIPYTITFDANGGKTDKSSVTRNYNEAYGELPSATRTGYDLEGWYTSASGGEKVSKNTKILANVTLYAHWTAHTIKISFDPKGGTVSTASKDVKYGSAYGELPTPTKTGNGFEGWFTSDGKQINPSDIVNRTEGQTLYAHWSTNRYTITFDANGGTASKSSITVSYDSAYGVLPTATRPGYTFDGWYTSATNGTKVTEATTANNNTTVYAHWTIISYTVKFDGNGGTASKDSIALSYGSAMGNLPTATREGHSFDGWYTAASGGTSVTRDTIVSSNMTVYAHWTIISYTVKFDGNGGSTSKDSITLSYGSAMGELPTATRVGHSFDGWYTAASGGTSVTRDTIVSSNMTVYAHWTIKSYTVTVVEKIGSSELGSYRATKNYGYSETVYPRNYNGYNSPGAQNVVWDSDKTITFQYSKKTFDVTVIEQSVNGTRLGSYTVTRDYGTNETISPKGHDGYITPASQTINWDSSKTITFNYDVYQPSSTVATFQITGKNWAPFVEETIICEYRNRTANTIEIRFSTNLTKLRGNMDDLYFNAGINDQGATNDIQLTSGWNWTTGSATSEWLTISAGAEVSSIGGWHHLFSLDGYVSYQNDGMKALTIAIPKY